VVLTITKIQFKTNLQIIKLIIIAGKVLFCKLYLYFLYCGECITVVGVCTGWSKKTDTRFNFAITSVNVH